MKLVFTAVNAERVFNAAAVFAVTDSGRPILGGVLLESVSDNRETVTIYATDSYKLIRITAKLEVQGVEGHAVEGGAPVILGAKSLLTGLKYILASEKRGAYVVLESDGVTASLTNILSGATAGVEVIEGTYPNAASLIGTAGYSDTFEGAAFNPVFLGDIAGAAVKFHGTKKMTNTGALKLERADRNRPAHFVTRSEETGELLALLMPVRI